VLRGSIYIICLFVGIGFMLTTKAQIVINEVSSRNLDVFFDEDGDPEDWFELYNGSDSAINLSGYAISDDTTDLNKWVFPEIIMQPGTHLPVFASGKYRKDVIDHWESIIYAEDYWRYIVPYEEPEEEWRSLSFNDSLWSVGKGGFGYGDDDDSTLIVDTVWTVYIRKTFEIVDTSKIINAVLHADYDDGFIAFINGIEVVRANMKKDGSIPEYIQPAFSYREAQMYQGGLPDIFTLNKSKIREVLRNGSNVLAIQAHSRWIDSDLSIIPYFSVSLKDTTTSYRPLPEWFYHDHLFLHTNFSISYEGEPLILSDTSGLVVDTFATPQLKLDISSGRYPDSSDNIVFFSNPSPGKSNDSSTFFTNILQTVPIFTADAGFYEDPVWLTLYTGDTGIMIRYTLNGSIPNDTSEIYVEPLYLETTAVVRAACFVDGLIPGETITKTYLINEDIAYPVVSISAEPYNLWDWEKGIYVKGPNAQGEFPFFGANFWEDWEVPAHIEFFDKTKAQQINQDAGIKIHGGWTRALPMKSLKLLGKDKYGISEFNYSFFKNKEIEAYKRIILRNAGNDFYSAFMRDALVHKLVQKNTHLDIQDYEPAIVFLNGAYWGIHNIREKIDRYYLQSNYNISPDELTLLEDQAQVIEGTNHEFLELIEFIRNNDLSDDDNFEYINSQIDLENFSDLMITEIYTANSDWPHHNVKFWKTRDRKWRYILLDLDASISLFSYTGPSANSIDKILNDSINYLSIILNNLLENNQFHDYFINRSADLMNTIFSPVYFGSVVDTIKNHLLLEMTGHKSKWGGTVNVWENHHVETKVKGFVNDRPNFMREHLIAGFELNKYDTLTVDMHPPGAAVLKLNTLYPDHLPWSGIYYDSVPVILEVIPFPGYTLTHWESGDSIVYSQDDLIYYHLYHHDTLTAHFSGRPDTVDLVISEINYSSHPNHNSGDWIELYNNDTSVIDLGLWMFQDSNGENIYTIPENTILYPDNYLVIANDTAAFLGEYPNITNIIGPFDFGLNNMGDSIRLFNKYGHLLKIMSYSVQEPWPENTSGTGRTLELIAYNGDMNEGDNWMAGCLGGSPGSSRTPCHDTLKIIVTEINYSSYENMNAGDWIELYNNDTVIVELSGWIFRDNNINHSFQIADSTFILPGQYLVLAQDSLRFHSLYPDVSNYLESFEFGLNSNSDELVFFDSYEQRIVNISYSNDEPWPGLADGTGRTVELINYDGDLNDGINWRNGCLGGSPGQPFSPCHDTIKIIITEINYYPTVELDAGEWIEIYNNDTLAIDLGGWIFTDDFDNHVFYIPQNTILNHGEFLVITGEDDKFGETYPEVLNFVGTFDFGLGNNGDQLGLYGKYGQAIFNVDYMVSFPWPVNTNGTGRTIELIDFNGDLNSGLNWKDGCIGGSPGVPFAPCDTNDVADFNITDEFMFYPNPATGQITLEIALAIEKVVNVYLTDQFGRKIDELIHTNLGHGKHQFIIDPQLTKSGVYFLNYLTEDKKSTYKLIYLDGAGY